MVLLWLSSSTFIAYPQSHEFSADMSLDIYVKTSIAYSQSHKFSADMPLDVYVKTEKEIPFSNFKSV